MDTINLVFKLVNNLKYYLEIDGVMVFPEKHQSKYCLFQINSPLTQIVTQGRTGAYIFRWRQVPARIRMTKFKGVESILIRKGGVIHYYYH